MAVEAEAYFPLRWESTGDQWWYASPIDWAAANGHYDLVRELLHLDTNLLIKLTSLRRIRRLETVWDDDARFVDVAKRRSLVARNLFHECEMKNGKNSLIRAGYGGWLLYTAASAGDMSFVQELLDRDPLLVFGEGEYGVTDIFYAAARSKISAVFKLLFDYAVSPRCSISSGSSGSVCGGGGGELVEGTGGDASGFRWEVVNRAVHAAARGGNLEFLKELLVDCSNVLACRDTQGSTILHTASGRGQVEVVKDLLVSFNMIDSRDNQENTALHVAAFRGYLSVVEALLLASPSSSSLTNNAGNTFLHMAVAGFRTPGFRRLDRQMGLMKQLITGTTVNIRDIINVRNNEGRTALHMAVISNVLTDLVELLMTVETIDLNIRDVDGLTPLDILRHHPRSTSSEILIKQLISAGGIANSKDRKARSTIASHLKEMQGIGNSPGTSFRVPDAEILLYAGIEPPEASGRTSSCSTASKSEVTHLSATDDSHGLSDKKKQNPISNAARHLKILLRWPRRKGKGSETPKKAGADDDESFDSIKKLVSQEEAPTPLREQFSKAASLTNNKRTLSVRSAPSPATKKKFAAGLKRGVFHAMPHLAPSGAAARTPWGLFSDSTLPSSTIDKDKGICMESENDRASCSSSSINVTRRSSLVSTRMMNQYLCFGAQELPADSSGRRQQSNHTPKQPLVSVV